MENRGITYLGESPTVPGFGDSYFGLPIIYMKVTRRYPDTGTPQSIDVELQTGTNWAYALRYPFSVVKCSNAKVVARDPNTHQVLGSALVKASNINSCVGTGRIPLTFSGSVPATITIEAYEDTVDVNHINSYTPLTSISVPIGMSYQQGLQTGAYSQPSPTGLLGNILGPNTLRNAGILLALGIGGYLVVKNGDTIKKLFSEAAT